MDERDVEDNLRNDVDDNINEGNIDELLRLGSELFKACLEGDRPAIKTLVKSAPLWYQEDESGWTVLHLAAANEDHDLVKLLLRNAAVWNAGAYLGIRKSSL